MSSGDDDVYLDRRGPVLVVSINRPDQRNAVNASVTSGIAAAMDLLESDPDLRAGVLHGVGTTFCAGMDLKAYASGEVVHDPVRGFAGLVKKPPTKPLIAAVEGWALGGGFEIALSCDLIAAARTAKFGLPEVKRGLAARAGGAVRLPRRIPHGIAMEVLLTGSPLEAERAHSFGLVNRLTETGRALAAAMHMAHEIASNAPLSVRASKRVALESSGWRTDQWFDLQRQVLDPVFDSEDAAEGVAAFRERRTPVWRDR